MAALIGRMWRSAVTHVLRDVSNVSPRIQPSNSLKNSVYIDYLSCHMKKNFTQKCIHFYINSNFLKSYYQLIKWALLQYCLSKAVGSIDIVSNFFSSGGHPCTRWIFGKNANSLQTGRSLSSSPHSLSANKPTTDIDTTTEGPDEVQTQ